MSNQHYRLKGIAIATLHFFVLVAGLILTSSPWAQSIPPEGPRRDALHYEATYKTDILLCRSMGYWMAVAQNQSREFASFEERKKLDDCVATARENAQKKYSDYRQKLNSDSTKTALKEHYISWIKTLEGLKLQTGESEKEYIRRFEENEGRMENAWIQFQVEIEE